MKKIFALLILFLTLFYGIFVDATTITKDTKLYVSGETIGVKLNTKIEVVGLFGISNNGRIEKPWENKIKEGDYLVKMDDKKLNSSKDLIDGLKSCDGSKVKLSIESDRSIKNVYIYPILKNDKYSLGLYIKDYILGIGTMTYVIPDTNEFGSVGHLMSEEAFPKGEIYEATVDSIVKPRNGLAGEKRASKGNEIGTVKNANEFGVYGILERKNENYLLMNYELKEDVHQGSAQILTCISGNKIEAFDIMITEVKRQSKAESKGISFEVIDQSLLSSTGGIIQGMSGSPIVQDNKLIGAVTHVLLEDPKQGYGIFIEYMLESQGVNIVK